MSGKQCPGCGCAPCACDELHVVCPSCNRYFMPGESDDPYLCSKCGPIFNRLDVKKQMKKQMKIHYFIAGGFLCRTKFDVDKKGPFTETVYHYSFLDRRWSFDVYINSDSKMTIRESPVCNMLTEEEVVAIILKGSL